MKVHLLISGKGPSGVRPPELRNVATTQRYIHTGTDELAGAVASLEHKPALKEVA